jgi:hypothetical protein
MNPVDIKKKKTLIGADRQKLTTRVANRAKVTQWSN